MRFVFSFGFQLNEWTIEIEIPKCYRFRSEREAQDSCRDMIVEAIVFPTKIAVLFEHGYMILEDGDSYHFRKLKSEVYEQTGVFLSPEDVSGLIEKRELEEVLLSENYLFDDTEYLDFELSAREAYRLLSEKYEPQQELPFGFGCSELKAVKGFHFESLYYQVKKN